MLMGLGLSEKACVVLEYKCTKLSQCGSNDNLLLKSEYELWNYCPLLKLQSVEWELASAIEQVRAWIGIDMSDVINYCLSLDWIWHSPKLWVVWSEFKLWRAIWDWERINQPQSERIYKLERGIKNEKMNESWENMKVKGIRGGIQEWNMIVGKSVNIV